MPSSLPCRAGEGHRIWTNGGETKLGNLVSLCRFHHHAVHEGGVQVVALDDGAFRFVKPNGEALDSVAEGFTQSLSDWSELVEINSDQEHSHHNKTAVTRWCGEKMDYGLGNRSAASAAPEGEARFRGNVGERQPKDVCFRPEADMMHRKT